MTHLRISVWTDPRWPSPEAHLFDVLGKGLQFARDDATRNKIERWLGELKAKKVVSEDLIRYLQGQISYCDGDKPYVEYLKSFAPGLL